MGLNGAATRRGLAGWIDLWKAEGWAVSAGRATPAGWPAEAELRVPDLTLASGDEALSWRGDTLLRVVPADHRQLQVQAVGTQRIQVGTAPPLELAAAAALGLVLLDAADAAVIQVEGLRARSAWGEADTASLRGRVTALSAALTAEQIGLPAGLRWPLGTMVEAASLDAQWSALPAGPNPAARA